MIAMMLSAWSMLGLDVVKTPAWMPLLEPMRIDDYAMLLLFPLIIGIAVVYKTIRLDNLNRLPRQAAFMATQIFVFLVLSALLLWGITAMV